MTDSQKHFTYRIGLIILLVAASYGATLTHGFIWDDTDIFVTNPLLEKLGNIPRFFLSADTINGDPTCYYRPVTYISFALERAVWGVNPAGYHVTNLVLHLLVVLLFYAVTAALFKKERLKNDMMFIDRMTKDASGKYPGTGKPRHVDSRSDNGRVGITFVSRSCGFSFEEGFKTGDHSTAGWRL